MKLKTIGYYSILLVFIITPLILLYFILVNTIFAKNTLPNLKLASSDISLLTKEQIDEKIKLQALQDIPSEFKVTFEDKEYKVNPNNIGLRLDTYEVLNYGKGKDLFKVILDGLNLIKGVEVSLKYDIDTNKLLNELGLNLNSQNSSKIIGNRFSCKANNYNFAEFNSDLLKKEILDSIINNQDYVLDLSRFINSDNTLIYFGCSKYKADSIRISEKLISKLSNNLVIDDLFYLTTNNGSYKWEVSNLKLLEEHLKNYKEFNQVKEQDGEYEIIDSSKIYMYKKFQKGLNIDIESTLNTLDKWLNSKLDTQPIVAEEIHPKILTYNLPILDFTQEMGVGKTRIELKRDGVENVVVAYTIFGLDEINKYIVNAGEEFSYINAIRPQANGTTKSGRPIAGGICNSTTTLFRAALESGLQITDRSYHAYYVQSYDWGYPVNIVDAAYLTKPTVDFKFKNDTKYPILIKVEYGKDSEYQYNTIKILSSSENTKRSVDLENWKVWDKFSATNFKGSFDRIVKLDGNLVSKDTFYSHYL